MLIFCSSVPFLEKAKSSYFHDRCKKQDLREMPSFHEVLLLIFFSPDLLFRKKLSSPVFFFDFRFKGFPCIFENLIDTVYGFDSELG